MKHYQTGTTVEWNWGSGVGSGTVAEIFTDKVTRTIKGNEVTRNASEEEPAYLIRQDDGDRVLKSHTELTKKGGASNK
ncbi:DUF2945 domain-containing protein [Hoeflea sp. WL0058]|uniref:DUF2945 domain-containing protein n=1 Tax=Flavimaribacter sediminis TaxID=2865987 RepID=A0AAE2ZSK9_9HYPH|nr:DUF2945 domain-containing protein [Flavimaribacter sediminis]MBW8640182.1 DUF2945 domain-containing protein [Flavimaribacter sediminis]